MGLLAVTLSAEPTIGANRRGAASGAGWLYCLPQLHYSHVVCLGSPRVSTLTALARAGQRVTVFAPGRFSVRRIRRLIRTTGWPNVVCRRWRPTDAAGDEIDLLVICGSSRRVRDSRESRLRRRLGPKGVAYRERVPMRGRDRRLRDANRLLLALTPAFGEPRCFLPDEDRPISAAVARLGLRGTILRRPKLARWERQLTQRLPLPAVPRFAEAVGAGRIQLQGVPRYLREIASASGWRLDGWTYGVVARGDFDTQKVLLLLVPPGATWPTGIVKITRADVHAARLQNEAATLRRLAGLRVAPGRVPEFWFSGVHAGRGILAASFVSGRPYVAKPRSGPDLPVLVDGLTWLTDLGTETARRRPAAEFAGVLAELLRRYARVYAPPSAELAELSGQFDRLAHLPTPIPSVQQHGDPGVWNLLVERGRCHFLDWESGEAEGMPLWDVLHLFRSYVIRAERARGRREESAAAVRHLTGSSPLADLLVATVQNYCARVGLAGEAVYPLVLGCWLHRALKEAARASAGTMDDGLSVRLLRATLADPGTATTARLRGLSTLGCTPRTPATSAPGGGALLADRRRRVLPPS